MSFQEFTRVVVGTDGSEAGNNAAHWAASLAKGLGVPLRVVMALPSLDPTPDSHLAVGRGLTQDVLDEYNAVARKRLDDFVSQLKAKHPSVEITDDLLSGRAVKCLLTAVGEHEVLVVGRQGHTGRGRQLLGGVADEVVTHARVPVVVVPDTVRWIGQGPVALGVDGPASSAAARAASDVAARLGAELVAVAVNHVELPWGQDASHQIVQATREAHEKALDEVLAPVVAEHPDLTVTRQVRRGNAGDVLVELSDKAVLVVTGSRGRGGFQGLLLGSTSRDVARRADAPVLVVRDRA